MKILKNISSILIDYGKYLLKINTSTYSFWYLPAKARVYDAKSFQEYTSSEYAYYLMDYKNKLQFNLTNNEGIIVLYYRDIGQQLNPEAAFQYALALNDLYISERNECILKKFLHYTDYFEKIQTDDGAWNYEFNWFNSKSPWSSALAQARGAVVMLRAWQYTKEVRYYIAMKNALAKFYIPVEEGGYLAIFPLEKCSYFEEYPQSPSIVINGFMASLICLWEIQYWTKDPEYKNLWSEAIQSLEKMLPYFTTSKWTIYDLYKPEKMKNYNSPFYHNMQLEYIKILSVLYPSDTLINFRDIWQKQENSSMRYFSYFLKLIRKIFYR
ncbi:MAG: hypothetical protein KIT27_06410 [Legionellales bacterium]|nr:hypothetical protein [Legionellales bacterium]